jgi:phospholipase/lecithinase/hemolysin
MVAALQGLGAGQILVPGMPDAGQPPEVLFFDTAAMLRSIVANPAAYRFTNVSDQWVADGLAQEFHCQPRLFCWHFRCLRERFDE